jgi:hypothetical protein
MIAKLISCRELKRQRQAEGAAAVIRDLKEAMAAGHLKPHNFSVQDLFVALHENGEELLRSISFSKSGGRSLREASDAVDTTAFSSIIGQIVFNKIKDAYQDPEFLWPDLCDTMSTVFLDGERIPGIGRLGDKVEVVDEGMAYPLVGLNEEYIDTAPTRKRGFIVPCTREIIVADRTGILLKVAGETGYWMGLNKEKRVLDIVTGQTNNYKRNGTSSNTYLTSGAYVNSQTGNALDASGNEWRALEKADLLFDAITDPNTSEPIIVIPDVLLVPSALKKTALRILAATEVVTVDNRANAATIRTASPNPYGGRGIKVLSSPYVKKRSGSATQWWYGVPKKAFLYIEVWGIEPSEASSEHPDKFGRDIWIQHKVSERGVAQSYEPRFMTQNDQ